MHNIEYLEKNGKVRLACRSSSSNENIDLNFNDGITAQYVSSTILTESDRQIARERSQKMKEEGTTLKERLSKITRTLTAGKMTIDARNYGLSKTIRDHVLDIYNAKKLEEKSKIQRIELAYMKLCYKADKVLEKYGMNNDVTKWKSKADIITYLKPLKNRDDGRLPTDRVAIESLFLLWKHRSRKPISCDSDVLSSFCKWTDEEMEKTRGNSKKRKHNNN